MTDNTQPTTAATKVFTHPALPQAHDTSLNYWAIFLQDADGYKYKGPTAAIPEWRDQTYVLDKGDWEGTVPIYATTSYVFHDTDHSQLFV